jgi:hypothetical protein
VYIYRVAPQRDDLIENVKEKKSNKNIEGRKVSPASTQSGALALSSLII